MAFRLISTAKFPPKGWIYYQSETGWRSPKPMETGFAATRDQIIAMRSKNPAFPLSTKPDIVEWELENFTCLRLKNDPHWVYSTDPAQVAEPVIRHVKRRCGTCS